MASKLVLDIIEPLINSGINYVCADCGAMLYHSGVDGAFEGGEPGFPSRQPYEVTDRLRSCPACGHKLNPQPDSDSIRVTATNQELSGNFNANSDPCPVHVDLHVAGCAEEEAPVLGRCEGGDVWGRWCPNRRDEVHVKKGNEHCEKQDSGQACRGCSLVNVGILRAVVWLQEDISMFL